MNLSENGLSLITVSSYTILAFVSLLLLPAKETRNLKLLNGITGVVWISITITILALGTVAEKFFIVLLIFPQFLSYIKIGERLKI